MFAGIAARKVIYCFYPGCAGPLAEVARATPDEPVTDLLPRLNACSDGPALVFADGRLAGIVAPADISRAQERISGNRGPFGSAGRWRRP